MGRLEGCRGETGVAWGGGGLSLSPWGGGWEEELLGGGDGPALSRRFARSFRPTAKLAGTVPGTAVTLTAFARGRGPPDHPQVQSFRGRNHSAHQVEAVVVVTTHLRERTQIDTSQGKEHSVGVGVGVGMGVSELAPSSCPPRQGRRECLPASGRNRG